MTRAVDETVPIPRTSVPGEPGRPEPTAALSSPFVGRQAELHTLRGALDDASSGRGRLVLLAGEPGIGKTRTADELARYAQERGCEVLVGRCYEGDGAPAYWPWLQVLRRYAESREPEALAKETGPHAADVAQILPALRELLPHVSPPPPLCPEQARFRLFDSIAVILRRAAAPRPLVVVLDDLHWADEASLLFLRFLVQEMHASRLLVLGTYRDNETADGRPLARALGEIARHGWVSRLTLRGLDGREVADFMAAVCGLQPPPSLVAAVHRETDGNPLFIAEVVRLLTADGRLPETDLERPAIRLPQTTRHVIAHRLDRLSAPCRHVLAVAAAIGRDFDLAVLSLVSDVPVERLLVVLGEAIEARLVGDVEHAGCRFRFAHALVRETLHDEMPVVERMRLHRAIATALETRPALGRDARLDAELAHHFLESAALGEPEKAVAYAVRAAGDALALLAYEEAARYYERALDVLALVDTASEDDACELLLGLGDALARAGDRARARETFARAATLARGSQAAERFARAALGHVGWTPVIGLADPTSVALLDEARRRLPVGDGTLRGQLLARLGMELCFSERWEEALAVIAEALAIGRRTGDVRTMAYALTAHRYGAGDAEQIRRRLADIDDLVRRAEADGDAEIALDARTWRIRDLLEIGDIATADAEIALCGRLAQELRHPLYLYRNVLCRTLRALQDGRFAEAERLAVENFERGPRVAEQNAELAFMTQMIAIRRARGPLEAIEPILRAAAVQHPSMLAWRVGKAVLHAEMGRLEEARAVFETLAAHDFTDVPPDAIMRGVTLTTLADVCAAVGDVPRARRLYELLTPFADRNIVAGLSDSFGAAARLLGMLAATMGRFDDAVRHFEAALAMNARMGALPFVALTQHAYAAMLVRRDGPGDRARARALLGAALETARALGMTVLASRVHALEEASDTSAVGSRVVMRREDVCWRIGRDGVAFTLPDSLGLRCLALLVEQPDRELLALHMMALVRGDGPTQAGDAGVALDQQATTDYARLAALRAARDDALALGHDDRVGAFEQEMHAVAGQLRHAVGFGGRARRAGSPVERARLNATRAIKAAVGKVTARDEGLGRHLATSVRTGTYCCYAPRTAPPGAGRLAANGGAAR